MSNGYYSYGVAGMAKSVAESSIHVMHLCVKSSPCRPPAHFFLQALSTYEWSDAMAEEATYFYFTHYRQHWCSKHLADALACIPQVMMWDDHDIFDGWGSYPHALLTCTVFQGNLLLLTPLLWPPPFPCAVLQGTVLLLNPLLWAPSFSLHCLLSHSSSSTPML